MSSPRTAIGVLLLVSGLLGGVARGQDSGFSGWVGPEQLELLACDTAYVASTRPAPRVLSSRVVEAPWSDVGYVPSPDGRTLLVPLQGGRLRVIRDGQARDHEIPGLIDVQPGTLRWHPDSRRVVFWVQVTPPPREGYVPITTKAVAVLDVTRLQSGASAAPVEVLHRLGPASSAWDVEWTADGQALRVLGREVDPDDGQAFGVVTSVPVATGQAPRELLRVAGDLDFVVGASVASVATSDRLLVGHKDGLFVLGERLAQLPDVPSAGIFQAAWSPDRRRDQLLLFYRRAVRSKSGALYQGVYLLDLDASPPRAPERLDEGSNVRGLTFSPRGRWATWSSPKGVSLRAIGATPAQAALVSIPARPDGEAQQVKGFAWSADEARLAIAAGNKLYVHDVANQALYLVLERGTVDDTTVSQPTWLGDRVVVSVRTCPAPRPGPRKGS